MPKKPAYNFDKIYETLSDWVVTYHKNGDDKFCELEDEHQLTNIYCDGPYTSDEDENGEIEVDENLILYYLSFDIYLADRILYIKEYRVAHPGTNDIEFDESRFPKSFSNYDGLCAWYSVDTGTVEFVPDLESDDNKRIVQNFAAFMQEYLKSDR